MIDLEGVQFEPCFERRKLIELDKVQVSFIGLDDLIEVKANTGRLQDLADAEQLKKIRGKGNREDM